MLFIAQQSSNLQTFGPIATAAFGAVGFGGALGACAALRKLLSDTSNYRVDLDGRLALWHSVIVVWTSRLGIAFLALLIVADLAIVVLAVGHVAEVPALIGMASVRTILIAGFALSVLGGFSIPVAKHHFPQLFLLRVLEQIGSIRFTPGWTSASYQLQTPAKTE